MAAEACGAPLSAAAALRAGGRADSHLLVGARRPAEHGQRRPSPRAAHLPQEVRRGPGHPHGGRAAHRGLRGAGGRAGQRGAGLTARHCRRRGRHGRRAGARHRPGTGRRLRRPGAPASAEDGRPPAGGGARRRARRRGERGRSGRPLALRRGARPAVPDHGRPAGRLAGCRRRQPQLSEPPGRDHAAHTRRDGGRRGPRGRPGPGRRRRGHGALRGRDPHAQEGLERRLARKSRLDALLVARGGAGPRSGARRAG